MKKLSLLVLGLILSFGVFAQYYYLQIDNPMQNPGGLNADMEYPVGGGLDASWTAIHGGSAASPAWTSTQTLPFTFNFNGTDYTECKVSTSGILTFTTAATVVPPGANANLPSADIPDNSICMWGLEGSGANDNIVVKTFGTAPNRQYWVFFASYNYNGGTASYWTYWSFVLEETSNKFYLIDQRSNTSAGCNPSLTLGAQYTSTSALEVSGSPNVTSGSVNSADQSDNTYWEFFPGVQPDYDLTATTIDLPNYLSLTNAPYSIKGSLKNYGKQTITTLDINYSIDGGAAVTAPLTGLSIAPNTAYNFTHPTNWNPATDGNYAVKVWASNLNGNVDENTANDEYTKNVQVVDKMVQRLALLEVYTSSTCAPCRPGNENLHAILDANPNKSTVVKFQQNFPGTGDPYATTEAINRRGFYGINSIPRMEVDGGWDGNASSFTAQLLDDAYNVPSFLEITATHTINWQTVEVDVTLNPLTNINSNNLKVHIAILENETFQNVKSNGETNFTQVMKKMIPNENGISQNALVSGTPVNIKRSYTFKGNYRLPNSATDQINHLTENSVEEFTDLTVLVWVQDATTKEVYQSAYSTGTILGVENPAPGNGIISMYPNPVKDKAHVDFLLAQDQNVNISVFNTLGNIVYQEDKGVVSAGPNFTTIDLANLSKGVYVMRLTLGENVYTRKFIVQQ
ncbi:MAG: T9SS type A sorting domain-containing protein [Bacteroidetes bacterium]|nr:T9SS type A sorting domain-containing protein [Bacteroidota bacterium]